MARLQAFCLLALLAAQAGAASVYEQVSARVVCVLSEHRDGSQVIGSGFFIAPGVLATVHHQIEGARRVSVHLPGGGQMNARPMAVNPGQDAALLRLESPGPGVLPLDGKLPALGTEVFTVGCPLGLSHTLTRGVVSHADRLIQGRHLIQTDLVINEGNSGGPLVNAKGAVVGVVHGRLTESNGINFAIPAAAFLDLLKGGATKAGVELAVLWASAGQGESEERARRYQEIVLIAPWAAEAYYNLGLMRLRQGRLEEAREHFETASLKQAPYPEALNNLGLALFRLGRQSEARDVLVRAVSARPDFALAHYNLGVVYAQGLNDAVSARRNFQRFLQLAPAAAPAAAARRWLETH